MPSDLVAAYFEYWKTEREDVFWAWNEVTDKVLYDPDQGWTLVLALIRAAPSDAALSYVAAGPLEDFLCKHGESYLPRLQEVAADPRVKQALRGVWGKNRMKLAVWSEVQRLVNEAPN